MKKGGSSSGHGLLNLGRRNWKNRWFVLRGTMMTYYEDFDPVTNEPVGAAKGMVNIAGGEVGKCPYKVARGEHQYTFAVNKADGAQMMLEAKTEKLMASWLEALYRCLDPDAPEVPVAPDVDAPEHYAILGLDPEKSTSSRTRRSGRRTVKPRPSTTRIKAATRRSSRTSTARTR